MKPAHNSLLDPKLHACLPTSVLKFVGLFELDSNPFIETRTDVESHVLLVAGGVCSKCSRKQFDPSKVPPGIFERIVVFYDSELSEIRKLPKPSPRFTFLSDKGGAMHVALNADWTPRLYVIDGVGKLLWLQSWPDEPLPDLTSKSINRSAKH